MSFPDAEGWVIVASKGGAPLNPSWFHNLVANPETTVEFGTETYEVTASVIPEDERAKIITHVATLDVRALAKAVVNTLFESLSMEFEL